MLQPRAVLWSLSCDQQPPSCAAASAPGRAVQGAEPGPLLPSGCAAAGFAVTEDRAPQTRCLARVAIAAPCGRWSDCAPTVHVT